MKQHVCADAGISYENIMLPVTATAEELKAVIVALNARTDIDAIHVERGVKANMTVAVASNVNFLSELVAAEKDVDGERPKSLKRHGLHSLLRDSNTLPSESIEGVLPCAVAGVLELMDHYQYSDKLQGANVVVIGRSRKLGLSIEFFYQKDPNILTLIYCYTPPALNTIQ